MLGRYDRVTYFLFLVNIELRTQVDDFFKENRAPKPGRLPETNHAAYTQNKKKRKEICGILKAHKQNKTGNGMMQLNPPKNKTVMPQIILLINL